MAKRVILIVMDSFGIGEEPDASEYGDVGCNTLLSCTKSALFKADNFKKLGLFNIDGVKELNYTGEEKNPIAAYARLREASKGKDTTIGHFEIAGVISERPLPTYPNGFPEEIIKEFEKRTGRKVICNKPYSGTVVINEYGVEHMKTGALIVYTSADSVFQIAAHEDVVPLDELYKDCKIAREILQGEHGVGRVIARPFVGDKENGFKRTTNRHDFSIEPPKDTMLDCLMRNKKDTIGIGKIKDIYAGKGISEYVYTTGNEDGVNKTLEYMDKDFEGLLFVNLVDFDMLYGHRNDVDGYASAVAYLDNRLPEIMDKMRSDDVLIITADHGCDPGFTQSTDHSREYVPFIMYGKEIEPKNYGTRNTFACVGKTVLKLLDTPGDISGESFT